VILYLVRHCRTDLNDQRRCQGTTDTPLNEAGRLQAVALGRRFSEIELDGVYSSHLLRATETARAIADGHNLDIATKPGLAELNQGELEGMDMAGIARNYPDLLKNWFQEAADTVMPGGESMRQLQERAWAAVKSIVSSYDPDDRVVAVSHNLALCTVVCKLLKIEIADFRRFKISPACVTTVEFGNAWPVILSLNDTSHLDGYEA